MCVCVNVVGKWCGTHSVGSCGAVVVLFFCLMCVFSLLSFVFVGDCSICLYVFRYVV